MAAARVTVNWSAPLATTVDSVSKGTVLCPYAADTSKFTIATTAALAAVGGIVSGVCQDNAVGGASVSMLEIGGIDASYISGSMAAGAIGVNSSGALVYGGGAITLGYVNASGDGYFNAGLCVLASLPTWCTMQNADNAQSIAAEVDANPVVGPITNEKGIRFTSGASYSDRAGWTGYANQVSKGFIAFGPDASVAATGCIRVATPQGTRTCIIASKASGSGVVAGREFQSVLNVSSGANGTSQSLELGRAFFEQTLLYGGSYLISVIDPVTWGVGSWLWEVEGYGYQYTMTPNLAGSFMNCIWGSRWNDVYVNCTARGGKGTNLYYQAGESSGADGGDIIMRGGYNGSGTHRSGTWRCEFLNPGATSASAMIEMAEPVIGNHVVALCSKMYGGITSTEMPANTGDGVVYLHKAATAPTANPVDGFILYVDAADNKLKARGPSGTTTTLANP